MTDHASGSTEMVADFEVRDLLCAFRTTAYWHDVDTVEAYVLKLERENTALRNLANNLQPGPISVALGGAEHEKPFRLAAGFAPEPEAVIDRCDEGHVFAKLADHPKRDGRSRCPQCLAIGLDAARSVEPEARHTTSCAWLRAYFADEPTEACDCQPPPTKEG